MSTYEPEGNPPFNPSEINPDVEDTGVINARFNTCVDEFREMEFQLTNHRLDSTVEVLDLDPDAYIFRGNVLSSPLRQANSLGYDVFRSLGYDILYATPALWPDSLETTGISHVKVMVRADQIHAVGLLMDNMLDKGTFYDPYPDKLLLDVIMNGEAGKPQEHILTEAFGKETAARAMISWSIGKKALYPVIGDSGYRLYYRDAIQSFPDAEPFSLAETWDLITAITNQYLDNHPELAPENFD